MSFKKFSTTQDAPSQAKPAAAADAKPAAAQSNPKPAEAGSDSKS